MKLLEKIKLKKISDLETIEEKSFWITAPLIALLGLAGLFTSGAYSSATPTITSAVLCLIIPLILMGIVLKWKNYHAAFPALCVCIGAVCIPMTFVFSGGFLSGMPIFCAVISSITALCYSPKWRFISFGSCLVGNSIAFAFVYINKSPFPLEGTEILYNYIDSLKSFYNDALFGYYCAAFAMFISINYITNDIRRYKLNQDTLQRFFDTEKRKEIFKNALKDETLKNTEHKKAAILFADISNFTSITEKMSSEKISSFLNEFFSTSGVYIHGSGGIIDKYIGDCIMAYWFDQEGQNVVLNAVQAMIDLRLAIIKKSEYFFETYGTELTFSVGIAYGDVIFGDIGSDTMHDYTVIGDAVNTASRIQDYAAGGEMLISDLAAMKVQDSIVLETVKTDHFFKGKNRSTDVYRIVGLASNKQETKKIADKNYQYELHTCGCRGSFPVSGIRFSEYGGETSCYVIKKDDYALIVDCGTGLKNAMKIIENCKDIDILLTHVHYDHILGFLMSKFPKNSHIRIFGHFSSWNKDEKTLVNFMEHPYWPVEIISTEKIDIKVKEEIQLKKGISAMFFPSDHPDEACVIRVTCNGKKVAFLADCENAKLVDPEIAEGAELVFFDGMFDDDDKDLHKGWGHGTWQDGVRYLEGKSIKKLVITHHNPELADHSLKEKETKARAMSSNVSFAKSGDIYNL